MSRTASSKRDFVWTDDEVELLLTVTHQYKVQKLMETVDWESIKFKYDDILTKLREELPATEEEAKSLQKDYPHTKEKITKAILTTKLKSVRIKFRQAVDSGRRSGHGRVVLLYYELCEKIWGGSPATQQIASGVESHDLLCNGPSSSSSSVSFTPPSDLELSTYPASFNPDESIDGDNNCGDIEDQGRQEHSVVNERRKLLDSTLSNYKQAKLKRKLPSDAQLVGIAKEELAMKKHFLDQMETMDRQYQDSMAQLSSNMVKISNSIANGFSLLQTLLVTQQPMYPHQPMYTLQPFEYHKLPHHSGHRDRLNAGQHISQPPLQPCDTEDESSVPPVVTGRH